VRGRWAWIVVVVFSVLLVGSLVGVSASSARIRLGQQVQFRVEDSTTWFWGCWGCCGCCTCPETTILGWRVVTTSEHVVYSVVHDAPVPSSAWQGTWAQVDAAGAAAPAGEYKLYVDTSVGTLARCFTLYDPCACAWCSPCTTCVCAELACITNCGCKTSLVFVEPCGTGCFVFPFFFWGCCGCP